jgi:phosphate transport system protein
MTEEHIVTSFDDELRELTDGLIHLGGLAQIALANVEKSLKMNDHDLAKKTIEADKQINALQFELEEMTFNILAKRQPMANDLRSVFSSVKIILFLERIGDMCKGVCKRIAKGDLLNAKSPKTIDAIVNLTKDVQNNLDLVLDDYAQGKADNALNVWRSDIKIDSSYASILTAILEDIRNKPEAIEALVPLFFIARYLERIGDQATNIAEVNHFIVTGEVLTDDRKLEAEEETVF